MSDGPFPWANFGETERPPKPETDLPMLPVPGFQQLQLMAPIIELDLNIDDGAPVQSNTENDSSDFPGDSNYFSSNSVMDTFPDDLDYSLPDLVTDLVLDPFPSDFDYSSLNSVTDPVTDLFPSDVDYSSPNSAPDAVIDPMMEPVMDPMMDPMIASVLDSVIESVDSMESNLVYVADVMPPIPEPDWPAEPSSVSFEAPPVSTAARLEDVIAQIDAEMATNEAAEVARAIEIEHQKAASQKQKHIMFSLAGARYAMPLSQVIEIGRAPRLMPLPNVPEWMLGVTNLRGDIISVIDLHAFLGLSTDTRRDSSRMCVVRAEQQEMITGLMVDRVEGVASLTGESFSGPTASLEGNVSQYLQGVGEHDDQSLRLLNLDSLLGAVDLNA